MGKTLEAPPAAVETLADLLKRLGNIPPQRIRARPAPGTATVQDVVEIEAKENRLFELVDGVLVEKAMGLRESLLALALGSYLRAFVTSKNFGLVTGPDGMMEILGGLVRYPDVTFISWQRLPGGRVPKAAVPRLAPDLAIEVLSSSNTAQEMARKRREYFEAGVRAVWEVEPEKRTVTVYTAAEKSRVLEEKDTLNGEPVLPGFSLSLRELFAELDRKANG